MSEYIIREEVYQKLHDAGGCGATDEWSKGYDAAIEVAISIIENAPVVNVAPNENIPKTILLERLALCKPQKEDWRKDNMEGHSLQTIRYLAALNVYNEIRELIEDWFFDTRAEAERSNRNV